MKSPIVRNGFKPAVSTTNTDSFTIAREVLESTSTPATEWAPRGRIFNDSVRGTIFWEAERSGFESQEAAEKLQGCTDEKSAVQGWSNHFEVEWLSANRLSFCHTRGLRNPWNANREIKIARDGTEIEPSAGERLIQLFHRSHSLDAVPPLDSFAYSGRRINPWMRWL
jgi:hypothetical protein